MSEAPSWIGARPSAPQIFALMFCGVTGLMIAGVQPLLLGALAEEGRVAAAQLGRIATGELLAMGLTAGAAGSFLPAQRLKTIGIAALIALAAANIASMFARGDMVMLVRAIAGIPSGLLVWVTIALIARAPTPERWAGGYLASQTLGQFVLAAFLTAFVLQRFGADGVFVALAALCLINAAAALLLPSSLAPLPQAATTGLPNTRGWIALAASVLFLAVSSGVWVYIERLSNQAHHDAAVAGQAVSLSLIFQVCGALAASLVAGRVSWFAALLVCVGVDLGVFMGFAALPGPTPFIALACALGFIWLFTTPFLVPMTIDADPTRRAALLIGGAQLIGGSLGPLFASFFVTDADARGALAFSAGCLIAAAAIVTALHVTHRPLAQVAD